MYSDRRSIRRYTEQKIEKDKLEKVLEAARWAPSWANSQCCELIVVEEGLTKKELSSILSPKNPATIAVEKAPFVIAICGALHKAGFYSGKPLTKFGDWYMYDLGLVTQNMCLAAHEQGLGTVIVGAFDHDKAKEILAVPASHEVVAILPLGYPDHSPSAPKRKSLEEMVHYGKF